MKAIGGRWDNEDVDLGDHQVGLLLVDRSTETVWVYDRVDTPDGPQLDVRESSGRLMDDDKRFRAGEDPTWQVRVVDQVGLVDEEVGL